MKFRLEEALLYPFRHWIPCILVPGLVVYADIILVLLLAIVVALLLILSFPALGSRLSEVVSTAGPHWAFWPQMPHDFWHDLMHRVSDNDELSTRDALDTLRGVGNRWSGPLYLIFWMGFEWQLFARWQKQGFDAPPPAFESSIWSCFKDGLKGAAFYIPLNIAISIPIIAGVVLILATTIGFPLEAAKPSAESALFMGVLVVGFVVIMLLLTFFISPFLIAPMIHSAQNRSIRELYNIRKAIEITLPRYSQILVSFLLIFALWWVYFMGSIVLLLVTCCFGMLLFPFIWEGAFRVSAAHLLAQAFDYQPPNVLSDGAPEPPDRETAEADPTGVRRRY